MHLLVFTHNLEFFFQKLFLLICVKYCSLYSFPVFLPNSELSLQCSIHGHHVEPLATDGDGRILHVLDGPAGVLKAGDDRVLHPVSIGLA